MADDVPAIAAVHRDAFAQNALSRLGPDLVERYYLWLLTGPHDVAAFGWSSDERLLGFVVSGRFRRALSGFVHQNRRSLAARVAQRPWLLASPIVRERIARSGRWVRRRNLPAVETEPRDRPSFGVLAIAVIPRARRQGGGQALMEAVEVAAVGRGCLRLHLTVEPRNEAAIRFYEGAGWRREPRLGRWDGLMVKELAPQAPTAGRRLS